MKKDIHPNYDFVVFKDSSSDFAFLTRSTKKSQETIKWEDGKEYPVVHLEVTSASHPFYTGKQQLIDSAGRVEKFMRKYGMKNPADNKDKKKSSATASSGKNVKKETSAKES